MKVAASKMPIAYESELVTLWRGDARKATTKISKDLADLIVTDPPYGKEYQSNHRQNKMSKIVNDHNMFDVEEAIQLILPILKRNRHLYVFGPIDFSKFQKGTLGRHTEIIWDKQIIGSGNLRLPWGPQHERISFAVKVLSTKNVEDGAGNLAARLRHGSVLRVDRLHSIGIKRHPTEKPVALLRQLIESSSSVGETVFDPFCGSGSTLIAAILSGRKAIGIELDEQYIEPMIARIQAAESVVAQMEKL